MEDVASPITPSVEHVVTQVMEEPAGMKVAVAPVLS
jgi:hypothetical protein